MDFYAILGVSKQSTPDEIKKAYRKLAMQYHPDKNPGDKKAEAKFKEIAEAYQTLSDPDKKSKYDRFGHDAHTNSSGYSSSNSYDFNQSDMFGNFSDIFGDFFGQQKQEESRGRDLRYDMTLTLKEVAEGVVKEVEYERMGKCLKCSGTGAKGAVDVCSKCSGNGTIRTISQTIFGQFVNVVSCPDCKGKGRKSKDRCTACLGSGSAKERLKAKVKVPKGVEDGSKIKLKGYGEVKIEAGDLYVYIKIEEDKFFKRDGRDIYCKVPISFADAVLGGEIEIPTLTGKVKMKIGAASKYRLKGRGIGSFYSSGDQIVELDVVIPSDLDKHQKELLKAFNSSLKEMNQKPLKEFKKFMEKN